MTPIVREYVCSFSKVFFSIGGENHLNEQMSRFVNLLYAHQGLAICLLIEYLKLNQRSLITIAALVFGLFQELNSPVNTQQGTQDHTDNRNDQSAQDGTPESSCETNLKLGADQASQPE
jgi:hypothetical protein